ncbi:tRNA-uridine aminocarboxypropyltransferase [Pseudoalteromonas fenneropenaei]|uniref:tRNA-uridine aminocarboxypropyltransferase n=1 Tax=Pseudoalteromonas fenneropenaei TaxID=1737459 RepID=A0ABV7CH81_9GAMM
MNNSVLVLRQRLLASATREFNARGGRVLRCETCLLAQTHCICAGIKVAEQCQSAVCILMSHNESFKPSNTGRLIADVMPDNYAFRWSRTEPEPELLALLNNPTYQPILVFPAEEAEGHEIIERVTRQPDKVPLFIFLDGTWREAKRMFRKSPYLSAFPVLSITPETLSDYRLRVAPHEHQLGTAEVACMVLRDNGESQAAEYLQQHFIDFRNAYLRSKNRFPPEE